MRKTHRSRQYKRGPPDGALSEPATVYVTETVMVLSPTTTVVLADGSGGTKDLERVAAMDQKIIIVLSTLCFGLLCVVAGLLIWYRRKPNRRKREQWEAAGEVRRMSVRPSPLLVTRSPSSPDDRSSRTLSTNYSAQHLCPRPPRESGAHTPEQLFDSERMRREDGGTERKAKPTHLTIDSAAIPYRKDERFGPTVPWTAGLSAEANSRIPTRPGRTTRAISYPSDAHLHTPHTPDSSFPLVALSQPTPVNSSIPPSPTHSSSMHHRRIHTIPIPLPPHVDTEAPKPTGRITPPVGTPAVEAIPGLPPSPPPSPATITSRNVESRSGSLSTQGQEASTRPPSTRPPSSQQRSESATFPTSRPLTAASDVRPLTSSTHLSLTSSYSADSSIRFSTLFFAPQGSTPPRDGPITEVVGKEGDLADR
ncbi:hypothetical protein FRC01_000692 [Tulasnella sp. 417]|nr:hypothetical protein FRC01_000692 [Tulasnella sp. 417]